MALVEILVHYSVLPRDFLITPISVPDTVSIMDVPKAVLIAGWDQPIPIPSTQEYGWTWITSNSSAVLRVPSAVIPYEPNYVINVLHPEFLEIEFGPPEPFRFDPRLK
jgi:RES domain-containing protein